MRNLLIILTITLFTGCDKVTKTTKGQAYNPAPLATVGTPGSYPQIHSAPVAAPVPIAPPVAETSTLPDFEFYDTNEDRVLSPSEYAVAAKVAEVRKSMPVTVAPAPVPPPARGVVADALYSKNESTQGFIAVTIAVIIFVVIGVVHSMRQSIVEIFERLLKKRDKSPPADPK